ncbi:MAG: hypothetical protein ACI9KS_002329, partial [Sulfitobacter sp.]
MWAQNQLGFADVTSVTARLQETMHAEQFHTPHRFLHILRTE